MLNDIGKKITQREGADGRRMGGDATILNSWSAKDSLRKKHLIKGSEEPAM